MRFRNKVAAAPTLEERLALAASQTEGALSIFEQAAAELDAAADTAHSVVVESENEVMRLRMVRDDAFRQKTHAAAKADPIRELLA